MGQHEPRHEDRRALQVGTDRVQLAQVAPRVDGHAAPAARPLHLLQRGQVSVARDEDVHRGGVEGGGHGRSGLPGQDPPNLRPRGLCGGGARAFLGGAHRVHGPADDVPDDEEEDREQGHGE